MKGRHLAHGQEFHRSIDRLAEWLQSLHGNGEVADTDFASFDATLEVLRVTQEALMLAKDEADRERARYYELFEFAPDPYLVTTPAGRIREANRAAAVFLGIQNISIVDKPLSLYVDAKDRVLFEHVLGRMRQTLRGEWVLRMNPRGGQARIAHVTAGAVREADDRTTAIRWIIRDISEQHRAERELRASRRRIRLMASKLALVEERERRRIASDIHDHISQSLAVAKLRLGMMREAVPLSHKPALDEVRSLLSEVIAQTRTLTFELSPAVLYELGLGAAIEWLLEQRAGYGIKFEFHNESADLRLQRDTAITLFQAAREVLANIIKHSGATGATFRLSHDDNNVRIEVQDNGTGFPVEETLSRKPQELGLGLVSMRERIVHLGGSVEIQSEPGNGTRVFLAVPLNRAKKRTSTRRTYAT
jgi:PAS domain S-box-containing protein